MNLNKREKEALIQLVNEELYANEPFFITEDSGFEFTHKELEKLRDKLKEMKP